MQIPLGYAQANLIFSGAAAPTGAQVTLGLDVTGFAPGPSDAAEAVHNAYTTALIQNLQVESIALDTVTVKYGPNATGPSGEFSDPTPGAETDDGVPPNTSMLVQKVTAFGGRAGRGRLFLPGLPETRLEDTGVFTALWVSSAQTAFDSFLTELDTANLPPVLLHDEGSPISTPTPITSFQPVALAATQRQRLRR